MAKPRLVFIDDDETELTAFLRIVQGPYDCTTVHWPRESAKLFSDPGPSIFVSDLYLPPRTGDLVPTSEQRDTAVQTAEQVAKRFRNIFADRSKGDKWRMRETMDAIRDAYALLAQQWGALGQSPNHGIALLSELRRRYPKVPVVFYSRKITPEDVILVLRAGAVDAIRKGVVEKDEVLARLATVSGP